MRVSVGGLCCSVVDIQSWLSWYNACAKTRKSVAEIECHTNVKSKYFKRVCPNHFLLLFSPILRLLLVIVFTLIVQLSVIIREYPNVLNLFLTSKSIFLLYESDSFINIEFSLLNAKPLVLFSFSLAKGHRVMACP